MAAQCYVMTGRLVENWAWSSLFSPQVFFSFKMVMKKMLGLIKQHHDVSQAHVAVKVHHSQQSVAHARENKTSATSVFISAPN